MEGMLPVEVEAFGDASVRGVGSKSPFRFQYPTCAGAHDDGNAV
jgi:hypothetical protein